MTEPFHYASSMWISEHITESVCVWEGEWVCEWVYVHVWERLCVCVWPCVSLWEHNINEHKQMTGFQVTLTFKNKMIEPFHYASSLCASLWVSMSVCVRVCIPLCIQLVDLTIGPAGDTQRPSYWSNLFFNPCTFALQASEPIPMKTRWIVSNVYFIAFG